MNTFKKADILIPRDTDFSKWSVVACDQYTSEAEYWEDVKKEVGENLSTLNLIFPEVYLSQGDERINKINGTMREYLKNNIFQEYKNSLFYVKRTLNSGLIRHGVIGCIDLEEYDFNRGSESLVRATEGTVLERIPPRVKIRQNAPLELPHVMLLIDDEKKHIIEPLEDDISSYKKIYDFDLMKKGGHITGYKLSDTAADKFLTRLNNSETEFYTKYKENIPKLVFAVGDGNHSLATAKTCWENIKKSLTPEEFDTHPARYALCELVNLHDKSLEFEPIHRVLFDVKKEHFICELHKFYDLSETEKQNQYFELLIGEDRKKLYIKNPKSTLSVGSLQLFLDYYTSSFGGTIDYIHGEEVIMRLAQKDGNIGFILPVMQKNELFETVINDGSLPRKTFSMGEANEKRFYLECKKIVK